MGYRILNYFISLLLILVPVLPMSAQQSSSNTSRSKSVNQRDSRNKKKKKEGPTIVTPLYNGMYVSADIYGLGAKLLGSDFLSSEVGISVNLKNRYLPVAEIGYGKTNTWNENGIHYKASAPYFRIGVDYNTRWNKLDYDDVLSLGVRYGCSSFKYNVNSAPMTDPVYGNVINNPALVDGIWGGSSLYNHQGMSGSMQWYEIVGSVRTKIFKNFYMGWTIRLKYRLNDKMDVNAQPWYVPGFGRFGAKATGMTYTLIYKFSLGAKKPTILMPIAKHEGTNNRSAQKNNNSGRQTPSNSK
jgi:hypothetical protein